MDIISIIKSWLERHLLPEKGLFYIGGSDTLPPPLDKADEEKAIYPDGLKIRALTLRISFP